MSAPETASADPYAVWPADRRAEIRAGAAGGRVGTVLASETEACRVWHLTLAPGERLAFHRHVLDYFWTVLTDGRARSHYEGGEVRDVAYKAGDTRHFAFRAGEQMTHDLENTGSSPLVFVTVEFKGGANAPLPLGSPGAGLASRRDRP